MLISPILAFKNPPKSPVTVWLVSRQGSQQHQLRGVGHFGGDQSLRALVLRASRIKKAIQYWNVLDPLNQKKEIYKTDKVGTPFADFANMMALRGFQPTKTWDVHKECKDLTKHRYTNQSKINESGPSFWTLVGRRRVQHGKDSPIVHLLARNDHHVVHLMGWSYL